MAWIVGTVITKGKRSGTVRQTRPKLMVFTSKGGAIYSTQAALEAAGWARAGNPPPAGHGSLEQSFRFR